MDLSCFSLEGKAQEKGFLEFALNSLQDVLILSATYSNGDLRAYVSEGTFKSYGITIEPKKEGVIYGLRIPDSATNVYAETDSPDIAKIAKTVFTNNNIKYTIYHKPRPS